MFNQYDVDKSGAIDKTELRACLQSLGAHMTDEQVNDMFRYAHMTQSTRTSGVALSFKEFLLCLAIGSVLQMIPTMRAYSQLDLNALTDDSDRSGRATPTSMRSQSERSIAETKASDPNSDAASTAVASTPGTKPRTSSNLVQPGETLSQLSSSDLQARAKGQRLVKALKLVLEAYCLFDKDGSGTIDKNEVLAMVDEENRKAREHKKAAGGGGSRASENSGGGAGLLSRERWEELDWDSDGQITFKEFLFAMMSWVGLEDEDDDDEDANTAALSSYYGGKDVSSAMEEDALTLKPTEALLAQAERQQAANNALLPSPKTQQQSQHLLRPTSKKNVEWNGGTGSGGAHPTGPERGPSGGAAGAGPGAPGPHTKDLKTHSAGSLKDHSHPHGILKVTSKMDVIQGSHAASGGGTPTPLPALPAPPPVLAAPALSSGSNNGAESGIAGARD